MGCCFSRHKNATDKEQPKEPQTSVFVQPKLIDTACPQNPSTSENNEMK